MALNGSIPKSVAFIVGSRSREAVEQRLPIGTGFLLGYRTEPPSSRAFTLYLVTAAHVIRTELQTWVRLRRLDGSLEDLPVSDWVIHDTAEVALAALELDESETPFDIAVLPVPDFFAAGAPTRYGEPRVRSRPMLGDTVYFVGLFSPIAAMGEQNVPLVRSGTLAAIDQEKVPIALPDQTVLYHRAHLIDCRAYKGFSGSPCFVQFPISPGIGGVGRPDEETELLGLISSHFDEAEKAKVTGEILDLGTIAVPVHLGVGVVTPAEAIVELLTYEEVVEDRRQREASYRADTDDSASERSD